MLPSLFSVPQFGQYIRLLHLVVVEGLSQF